MIEVVTAIRKRKSMLKKTKRQEKNKPLEFKGFNEERLVSLGRITKCFMSPQYKVTVYNHSSEFTFTWIELSEARKSSTVLLP